MDEEEEEDQDHVDPHDLLEEEDKEEEARVEAQALLEYNNWLEFGSPQGNEIVVHNGDVTALKDSHSSEGDGNFVSKTHMSPQHSCDSEQNTDNSLEVAMKVVENGGAFQEVESSSTKKKKKKNGKGKEKVTESQSQKTRNKRNEYAKVYNSKTRGKGDSSSNKKPKR